MKNGDMLSQAADDDRDAREAKGKPCCLTVHILFFFPPKEPFFSLTSFFMLL